MIRFKDQILEDYFIDPVTAVITDQNGVVQETYLHHGRPVFKGMGIHCIMAHTFYGYRPGYDIHHLDENKLNNALSNLEYLSRSEHIRLHTKGKEKSDETRTKLSAALKGKTSWNKGKPFSEETKEKMSAAHKGKPMSEEIRVKISASCKGKHWWHLLSGEAKQAKECPGPEWFPGRK